MAFYAKKICAIAIFGILLGLLVRYVNGCTTFCGGALTAYALWCVVNWFHLHGDRHIFSSLRECVWNIVLFFGFKVCNSPLTVNPYLWLLY